MATKTSTLYGLLAEFDREDQVVDATRRIYEAGYRRIDAYAPFPVHGLAEAMGRKRTWVPTVVLAGGVMGGIGGFFMQWYSAVVDYPLNIGGRPMNSWPAFIPIVFELTVLGAALAAVFGMLAMNGLPQPYHPVFHVRNFELASRSRFFLLVTSRDPKFDLERTRRDLESLSPRAIHEVPH
jgi:hypothetical protein